MKQPMPDDPGAPAAGEGLRLCRHIHSCGPKLCLRYSLSNGDYVGEIEMAAKGDPHVWQMLAYDLLAVTCATVENRPLPEAGDADAEAVHSA